MRKAQVTFNVSIVLALTVLGIAVYTNKPALSLFAILWIIVDTIAYMAYIGQGKRKRNNLLDD